MAERVTQKAKRQAAPARTGGRTVKTGKKQNSVAQRAALERERDELQAQLGEARARIIKLEQARDEAVNRIDWAIDSLHNVLESEA